MHERGTRSHTRHAVPLSWTIEIIAVFKGNRIFFGADSLQVHVDHSAATHTCKIKQICNNQLAAFASMDSNGLYSTAVIAQGSVYPADLNPRFHPA